jgi:hypothetical protein
MSITEQFIRELESNAQTISLEDDGSYQFIPLDSAIQIFEDFEVALRNEIEKEGNNDNR